MKPLNQCFARWVSGVSGSFAKVANTALILRRFRNAKIALKSPSQTTREFCQEIPHRCDEILRFGRESDHDFTALAKGLSQISSEMTDLTNRNTALLAALADEDEKRALSSAYALYKNSVDLVHASMGITLSEQERMTKVEERLAELCSTRDIFSRNGMLFRILTMEIRMEASRMDPDSQTVFLNVAAAIADTERKIASTTDSAFNRISAVVKEAEQERKELKILQETLHERACHSIQVIRDELDKVRQALTPCIEDGKALKGHIAEYMPRVLHIITALQYQDIVRQQLEHVASGFNDISGHIENRTGANGTHAIDLGFVHHATEVQCRHLKSARTEIDRAGSAVVEGMKELIATGDAMAARFTAMDEAADRTFRECRIADLFREEITKLAQIGSQSEITNTRIAKLVERIEEVVHVFSEDISRQEFEVILVALNAQVAAARTNSADALTKLAEETSSLSGANAELTHNITGKLQEILTFLRGIKGEADEFKEIVRKERHDLEEGAGRVSLLLTELSEGILSDASAVNTEFSKIRENIQTLLDNLRFPTEIPATFDPAIAFCERLLEITDIQSETPLSESGRSLLDAHRMRYTMEEEHAAHNAVITRAEEEIAATSNTTSHDGGEIEIFESTADTSQRSTDATSENSIMSPNFSNAKNGVEKIPSKDEQRNTSPQPAKAKSDEFGDGIELF